MSTYEVRAQGGGELLVEEWRDLDGNILAFRCTDAITMQVVDLGCGAPAEQVQDEGEQ